jgi:hypothetical protein
MRIASRSAWWPREMVFLLAMLALAVQVVVPPGFMVGGQDNGPTRIVICTVHGPVSAAVDLGKEAPSRGKKLDAPCAFAGHAAPANLAPGAPSAMVAQAPLETFRPTPPDQVSVGRGLAPPPPARAPPVLLT